MAKSYTKIDNDIISSIAKLKLTGASSYMVLMAIIRNTTCFHRDQHEMSNSYLANATGLSERSVIRAVKELEERGVIRIMQKNNGSIPRTVKILTDRLVTLTGSVIHTDNPVRENTDNPVRENTDNPVREETKEEIKEEIKEKRNARAREASLPEEKELSLSELATLSQEEEE